jgi:protocatechuate 3,4-dioxygenase beta subunit
MTLFTRYAIACFLFIVTLTICGHAQPAPPKETATISGKVTVQGNAVQGVIITLRSMESTSYRKLMNQRGVTNANGEYRITNVPPGNYIVLPASGSFVTAGDSNGERTVIVNKAETIEDFDFSLMPGGVITGRVIDPDGRPVLEEEIHVFPVRDSQQFSPMPATITDDRGVYRIFGLKPGEYRIAAGRDDESGSGRRPSAAHVRTFYPGVIDVAQATVLEVKEGTEATNIDITVSRLLTTYTVSGRVVDGETGEPVANIKFGFKRFNSQNPMTVGNKGPTNKQGEFKLGDLVPGQYTFMVWPEPGRYVRVEEVRFEIVDRDVTGLLVKTIAGASLSGVVVLDGPHDKAILEQLRNAQVVAFVATEATRTTGISGVLGAISSDGSFRIGGLPAGTANFQITPSNRFRVIRVEQNGIVQFRGVEIKQGETVTGLRIVVGYADASIRGAVEIANGPLPPNARISVTAKRPNEGAWVAQIDPRGQFLFETLVPGPYEVTASVLVAGSRTVLAQTKQEVMVVAGSTNNVTIKLDLKTIP